MLIDHSITISQVFHLEGEYSEELRQEILTRTRTAVLKKIGAIQSTIIETIIHGGGEIAGKARVSLKAVPYEAPSEAVEVVNDSGHEVSIPSGQIA